MNHDVEPEQATPILSVVMVVGAQRPRAAEAVRRHAAQRLDGGHEVVVVDATPEAGREGWPEDACVRYVDAPALPSLADGKAMGATLARGRHIAFCEDHCHVEPGWAAAVVDGFAHGADAVAYAFGNLNPVNYVSRAFLLLAYGPWMSPVASGWIPAPSWMNVAYRGDLVRRHLSELVDIFHCETMFHARLQAEGARFWQAGDARVLHLNHPRLFGACRDSAVWQRLFAATRTRVGRWSLFRRLAYASGAPFLSAPLITYRLSRRLRARPELRGRLLASLPLVLLVYYVGAQQEALGYLFGAGDSGRQSFEVETSDPRTL